MTDRVEVAAGATLESVLTEQAERRPTDVAVIIPDGPTQTHAQLLSSIQKLRAALRENGVRHSTVVSIAAPNNLTFLVSFLATTCCRAIAAPLNPAYKTDEFAFYLEDLAASVLLVDASFPMDYAARQAAARLGLVVWDLIERDGIVSLDTKGVALPQQQGADDDAAAAAAASTAAADSSSAPQPDDVALFLHTSGTTSRPKGVPLTHANLVASTVNIINTYRLSPADRSYIVMPLFHVHGLIGTRRRLDCRSIDSFD